MKHTIFNDKMSITVDEMGAELVSVVVNGKEWIWQNQTGDWAGHSPLLFPVCGHCGVKHNGVEYPIKSHGFAKRTNFTLAAKGEDYLDFIISANEETKKVYPFDFILHVIYRIHGAKLTMEYVVENTGDEPLYFACGSHESYNLNGNVDDYQIVFDKEEEFTYHFHNDSGYMTGETQNVGAGKIFALPRDFLQEGRTVIFKSVKSRKVRLEEKNGKAVAELRFDGFENLLLWRGGDAPFICIEPWTCLPDPVNTPDVEISQKAGMVAVAPNETKTMAHSIEYL